MLGHDGCLETVDTWVQEIYLSFVAMSVGWNRIPRNDACLQSAGFQNSTSARYCCRWVTYLTDTGGPTLIFNQTTPDGLSFSLTLCRSRSLRRAGPGPAIPPPPPTSPGQSQRSAFARFRRLKPGMKRALLVSSPDVGEATGLSSRHVRMSIWLHRARTHRHACSAFWGMLNA